MVQSEIVEIRAKTDITTPLVADSFITDRCIIAQDSGSGFVNLHFFTNDTLLSSIELTESHAVVLVNKINTLIQRASQEQV
jgi:hypothetical protein